MLVPAILIILVAFCLYLTIEYSIFLPPVKGLPILMYHKVSPTTNDGLTISVPNLEKHFRYFSDNAYACLPLKQVIENPGMSLPSYSFVLTFDDAYLNNLEYLYPMLQKYGFHATIMLPVGHLGKLNGWDKGKEPIMNYQQLRSMDSRYISFGLHSYDHISLKDATLDEVKTDINKCFQDLNKNNIIFLPVLAYPYGAYPKDKEKLKTFAELLENLGVKYGLRIGNRINKWPLKTRYEIRRIDIRGDDSFWHFKTKLKKGRVKMF